jgi:hypothetical protein
MVNPNGGSTFVNETHNVLTWTIIVALSYQTQKPSICTAKSNTALWLRWGDLDDIGRKQQVSELKVLLEARIRNIKHSVLSRVDRVLESSEQIGDLLSAALSKPDEEISGHAYKMLDAELLIEIGRLKAYVEIYKELTGGGE